MESEKQVILDSNFSCRIFIFKQNYSKDDGAVWPQASVATSSQFVGSIIGVTVRKS